MFFFYINILITAFLMIFRIFPTTFRGFPNILQNCSEGQTNVPEYFSENFSKFRKISEECRRLSRKTPRCFDDTPTTNLISPKSSTSSDVRISYRFYQFVTTRHTTDFYISSSNHRLESAGLNALEELLFRCWP